MLNPQHAHAAAPPAQQRAGYDWLDVSFILGIGLLGLCLVAGLAHNLWTRHEWPRLSLDHLALGDEHRDRGDLVSAIREYQMTLLIAPNDLAAARRLANAFAAAGLAEREIDERTRVARLAPGSPESWVSLGAAQLRSGRIRDALASFEQALERDGRHAGAHAGRGEALARLGQRDEALASYATAIELRPGDGALLNHAAIVHVEAGQLEEGIRLFRAALESHDDPAIRANLSRALAQREGAEVAQ